LAICLEFVDGGTLSGALKAGRDAGSASTELTEWAPHKLRIACGVADALAYLHGLAPRVIHRDIKSENILLTARGLVPKLADFGESREMEGQQMATMTQVGTPYYLAPEIARGDRYDQQCDVYSLGVVMLEMGDRQGLRSAFNEMAGMQLVGAIVDGWRPELPSTAVGEEASSLIRECMRSQPRERPSAVEVLRRLKALADRGGDGGGGGGGGGTAWSGSAHAVTVNVPDNDARFTTVARKQSDWTCEKCKEFKGTYDEVSAHEESCGGGHMSTYRIGGACAPGFRGKVSSAADLAWMHAHDDD
jgi:serine/threonine protein kinase